MRTSWRDRPLHPCMVTWLILRKSVPQCRMSYKNFSWNDAHCTITVHVQRGIYPGNWEESFVESSALSLQAQIMRGWKETGSSMPLSCALTSGIANCCVGTDGKDASDTRCCCKLRGSNTFRMSPPEDITFKLLMYSRSYSCHTRAYLTSVITFSLDTRVSQPYAGADQGAGALGA